ncbi:MAG TPA: hypothetical protein VN688_28155 [Gemmataceae bacterium]|nr:hypothetical protein [Gemmataceae bacterium]
MTARVSPVAIALVLTVAGCVSDEKKLTTVSPNSFNGPVRTQSAWMKHAPQATEKVSIQVMQLGQKILAANPRMNPKTTFLTLGVPELEIFHQVQGANSVVYITEGLVKQCKTDGELAALLCQELGKMSSEQIAKARPMRAMSDRPPLMTPRVGNDIGGTFGSADGTDQMILTRYEKEHRQSQQPLPPPPPESLARGYLQSAGFNPKDLETVAPLLRKAEQNNNLEPFMTGKAGR